MSETTPEPTPSSDSTGDAPPQQSDAPLGEAGERALAQERELRKTAEKAQRRALQELEEFRKGAMSEQEKAIAEAEQRGRDAARADYGHRLIRTEFAAAAAKRNPNWDSSVLDDLNLDRFLGEDGEPDTKAIEKAAERWVPNAASASGFDLGEKPQSSNGSQDMNQMIRRAAGRA
jgi:hypothetical protein